MAHPYHHALSSVKKWGGSVEDYLAIHSWFDASKEIIADFRHRALRHHAEGIFMAETIFGVTITLSSGRVIPTRWIGEQHVQEDLGHIPSFADWARAIRPITRSSWSLNTTSRTMSAEVHIPNPDGKWRPGQYVQARLTAADVKDCLSLPKSAVVTQDKQTYCFAVDSSGKVLRLPISLGLQAGTDVEIRDGLTGDEQVISVNAGAFREGQMVEATPPAK